MKILLPFSLRSLFGIIEFDDKYVDNTDVHIKIF